MCPNRLGGCYTMTATSPAIASRNDSGALTQHSATPHQPILGYCNKLPRKCTRAHLPQDGSSWE